MIESRLAALRNIPLLNAPQREAVRHLDGPCLVLAGAGSGKTRVITHKVAYLIQDAGYEARQIAALTFTNKAAKEMRQRCATLLEASTLRGLTVCTFHALGVAILRQEAAGARLKPQFSILDTDDTFGILQGLCASADRSLLRAIQTGISLWKSALVGPQSALANARDETEAQHARVYRDYEATLAAYQAVDFDDLIGKPVALFEEQKEVLFRWQSRLRYLLVDEVQDTNSGQYRLLRQIAGERAMFTAVGDDDQGIYGWRGATLENLAQIQVDFPRLKVVKLEQNYRSSQSILAAANALIGHNPKLFQKTLWSEHGPGDALVVRAMNDDEHEAESIAIEISAHRFERHGRFSDYAILYRGNYQAKVFEQALRKLKIPYVLSGGQSFFDRVEIKDVCAWLRLLANQDDDPAFIRAITTPKRGVGVATLEALGEYAGQRHLSLFAAACESAFGARIDVRRLEPLREFTTFMNRLEWRAAREPADVVLDDLVRAVDFEAALFDNHDERTAQTKWQNVLDFIQWIKQRAKDGAMSLAEATQSVVLLNMLDDRNDDTDAVRLSTLHAAKGLEFLHVFLVGIEEGLMPHKGHPDDDPGMTASRIEEERRLMYVGITRAMRSLQISWCKKRRRAREFETREPSRFIAELALEAAPATVPEKMSAADRLSRLKALLAKPRPL